MDNLIVKILQYIFLDFHINCFIWIILDKWCNIIIQVIFLTETVKWCTFFAAVQ